MDESGRMKMGCLSPQKQKLAFPAGIPWNPQLVAGGSELDSEDFSDVFGGPPRSVLHRQFSGNDYTRSSNLFYDKMFRPPVRSYRNFPEFRMPIEKGGRRYDRGFYGDVFGREEEEEMMRRSRTRSSSKSKASSSSALSSEDVSPLHKANGGDCYDDVSFYATKPRWNITGRIHEGMPEFSCHLPSYNTKNEHNEDFRSSNHVFNRKNSSEHNEDFRSSNHVFNRRNSSEHNEDFRSSNYVYRRNSSPESISLDPISSRSHKVSTYAFKPSSPSSVVSSSVRKDHDDESKTCRDEDDEVMSSYVIEINPDYREGTTEEEITVNEAIAWAKEKFQGHSSENNLTSEEERQQSGETEGDTYI